MLYLNREDIHALADYQELIAQIEVAMQVYDARQFVQPDRITVNVNETETYLYMPCFTQQMRGTKFLTLSQHNHRHNLPTIQGVMLLNDPQTDQIVCMLDGASVTAFRTGAVGAVGIRQTAPADVRRLGLIGSGVQAFYQALYAASLLRLESITVYDILPQKSADFAARLRQQLPGLQIKPVEDVAELLRQAQVIITATPATSPVLPDDADLLRGKHFIGIGSYKPTMREYPRSIYGLVEEIYIDVDFALEESGDLVTPCREGWFSPSKVRTLYRAMQEQSIDKSGTTFYKSVGMALFDLFVAQQLYEKALARQMGQEIRL